MKYDFIITYSNMMDKRKLLTKLLLFVITVYTIRTDSSDVKGSKAEKRKTKSHSSKSKLKIDKGNPWPFLPSAGSHHTSTKGYPSYPFMILSPPGREKENDGKLQDIKGSKYFVSRRQAVPYPPQNIVGYVPVYYTAPQYSNTYQPVYMNYYQPDMFGNAVSQQYSSGGQMYGYPDYPIIQNPFFKRSKAKHARLSSREKNQPRKRQFLPRHHWAFSQWPFDSHEYAFTKDPIHSLNVPHLPRVGPIEWGGAGPGRHWAINREGLPSPFGIGLAPHMGGQGHIGLAGYWPAGHGFPFPAHYKRHH